MAKLVIQVDDSQATRALAQITAQAKKTGVEVKVLNSTFGGTSRELKSAERAFNRLAASLDPAIAKTQRLERAQKTLDDAVKHGLIRSQAQYNDLAAQSQIQGEKAAKGYRSAAAGLQSYLIGFASMGFAVSQVRALADAQRDLERIQARLRVAAGGDAGLGAKEFEFVSEQAQRLGLNLQGAAAGYGSLAVAARGTALEGEGARDVFLGIAEASAAMGLSSSQTELALKAVEQMISKGTISMEEMRRQLGDQIPGAFQIAARAMGVTTAELDKMIRSGSVMAEDLLPKFERELRKVYGEEAARNIHRLTGATENFASATLRLRGELSRLAPLREAYTGSAGFIDRWASALKNLNDRQLDAIGLYKVWIELLVKTGGLGPFSALAPDIISNAVGGASKPFTSATERFNGSNTSSKDRVSPFGAFIPDLSKLDAYEAVLKKIAKIEKDRSDRIENLDLLAWERSFDAPFELIDIGDRIDYKALGEDANRSFEEGWLAAGADLDLFPAPALDESVKVASESFDELRENFIENFQRATGDVFYDFLQTGTLTFESLWDTFKDLAFRAIAEAAAKMATLKLAQGSSGGGGGFGSLLGGLGLKGLAGWGTRLTGLGGGATGLYGPTAAGGNLAGAGGAAGAAWGFAAIAAIAAFNKYQKDQARKKQFDTTASVRLGAQGLVGSSYGWLAGGTGSAVSNGILALLEEFQSATGLFINGMEEVSVKIRHDKKVFQVGNQVFRTMEDAILAAAKNAFLSADLSGTLDPAIRQFIEKFRGEASGLGEGVRFIQQILDESSGLSALGQQIKGFAAEIDGVYRQLVAMGLDSATAQSLAGDWGARGFADRRRQLTGETESEEQIRARLEGEAELYNAELELYRAQLEGRKATLEAQLEIGVAELTFKKEFVDGEFRIFRAEAEGMEGYLGARAQFAERQAELWRAELAAIDKTLDALGDLDINLGDIKIPKIGGSLGGGRSSRRANLIDRWESAMERLIDAVQDARLGESTTGLTLRERVSTAYSDFQSLLGAAQGGNLSAAEGLPDALRTVLDLAKQYTGGGSGLDFLGLGDGTFRSFFDLLTGTAEEFALGPRPGKIREGNVVFDRRFHEAQERQIAEAQALRQQEGTQLKAVIQTTNDTAAETRETNRLLRKLTQGVDRITRVA